MTAGHMTLKILRRHWLALTISRAGCADRLRAACCWIFLWFAVCGIAQLWSPPASSAQDSNANAILFDRYEGTLVEFGSASITISTLDGDKTFSWAKAPRSMRNARGRRITALSVQGIEKPEFLKPGMMVHFVGELDREGKPAGEIPAIQVTSLRADQSSSKDPLGEADADTGNRRHRISGRVQSFDAKNNSMTVELLDGRKSERLTFRLNPEKTQVVYNLPEPSIAQAGDIVTVRCLPPEAGDSLATEIQIVRTNSFTGELTLEEAIVKVTGMARGYPVDDEMPLVRDPRAPADAGAPADAEPGAEGAAPMAADADNADAASDVDEGVAENEMGGADENVEVFDFPDPDAQTQQEFNRRLTEILPGGNVDGDIGGEIQAEKWRNNQIPRPFRPKPNPDRRWFKIN